MTSPMAAPDEREGCGMVNNYAKLEFLSCKGNVDLACEAVAAFVLQFNPTLDNLNDIKTITREAVANSVAHGYPDKLGVIVVKAKMLKNSTLEIIVRDRGKGIEDLCKAQQPLFTTGGDEFSGMGFTIMECYANGVTVRSAPGKGTTVTMRKHIDA